MAAAPTCNVTQDTLLAVLLAGRNSPAYMTFIEDVDGDGDDPADHVCKSCKATPQAHLTAAAFNALQAPPQTTPAVATGANLSEVAELISGKRAVQYKCIADNVYACTFRRRSTSLVSAPCSYTYGMTKSWPEPRRRQWRRSGKGA